METKVIKCWKPFADFSLLLLVFLPVVFFRFFGKPYQRGFNCDDDSLRYPFQESTVTSTMLYSIGMFVPIVSIMSVEAFRLFQIEKRKLGSIVMQSAIVLGGRNVHPYLCRIYAFIGFFMFGAAMSQTTTDIGKYVIGRLRPHFIDVCRPNLTALCTDPHAYVTEYTCYGDHSNRIREMRPHLAFCDIITTYVFIQWICFVTIDITYIATVLRSQSKHRKFRRLSFPSGHSSFSFYTMAFAVIYLQARLSWNILSILARPVLQLVFISMAVATALSRISNYKHHWSDVFAGTVIGLSFAYFTAFRVANLFNESRYQFYVTEDSCSNHSVDQSVEGVKVTTLYPKPLHVTTVHFDDDSSFAVPLAKAKPQKSTQF